MPAPDAVVLDLGGDVGAAVVTGPTWLDGVELEFRPAGAPWAGAHVAFHRRQTDDGPVTAAVLPGLPAGVWEVRLRDTMHPSRRVVGLSVAGGRVTRAVYPA